MDSGFYKKDIRPEFLGEGKSGADEGDRRDAAAGDLDGFERNATSGRSGIDGLGGAREKEEIAGGFYSIGDGGKKKKKGKKRFGILKKGSPMVAIVLMIGITGAAMGGAQTLMPIAISELITEKLNSVGISSTVSSDTWLNSQLNYGVGEKGDDAGYLKSFAFSEHQVKQFEKQNIHVLDANGGTALLYQKNDGTWVPVVGSKNSAGTGVVEAAAKIGISNVAAPISTATALADVEFKDQYIKATKTWRGGVSGWFDKTMSQITEIKLGITRNRWAKYAAKVVNGVNESFVKAAAKAGAIKDNGANTSVTRPIGDGEDGLKVGDPDPQNDGLIISEIIDIEESVDPDTGKTIPGRREFVVSSADNALSGTPTKSKLKSVLSSKALAVASTGLEIAGEFFCPAIEGLMSIYTLVSAEQSLGFLNLITGFLEATAKIKAGDGSESPINEYMDRMTTKADKVVPEGQSANGAKRTAMESAGMDWLFSGTKVSSNNESVKNTNIETIMKQMMSKFGNTLGSIETLVKAWETCGYIKLASSALGLATTVLSIFTFGISSLVKIGTKEIISAAAKLAISTFFQFAIPKIVEHVANVFIKDVATEWLGEDLGNALMSGAGKFLGGNGTSGVQGPGDKKKVLAYTVVKQEVIAEEAEYQRRTRSPFDATSPYTFLGSLAYAALPLAFSGSGVWGAMKDVSSLVTSAVVGMLPIAGAVDVNDEITSIGDCPLIEGTGAVGDAFCNPMIVTDMATIKTTPEKIRSDIKNKTELYDSEGNVNGESDEARFLTYCGQRVSQYGVRDAAIAEQIANNSTAMKILRFVPVLNDIAGIIDSVSDIDNGVWVTGEACVVSDDNPYWNGDKLNGQLVQREVENQRLLENMDPTYRSAITAYLEDYNKANPIDNSYEGQLARFSGMTKEQVGDTLALIEYYEFLAEYDPTVRYGYVDADAVPEEKIFFEESDEAKQVLGTPVYAIIYADLRNRNIVA